MSVSSIRNASKPSVALLILGSLLVVVVVAALSLVGAYSHLVTLDQAVQSQWGQVESSYQRRADLIPNLVATVKGAANFEKSTCLAVAEPRSKVGQLNVKGAGVPSDPAAFAKFTSAQDGLSSALSRLLVVSENYPDLKASQNFADLQAQLGMSE
jgi:LemA protein